MPSRDLLSLAGLAWLAGAMSQMIGDLLAWDIVTPCERDPEPRFVVEILPQVRKAVRLHYGRGVCFRSPLNSMFANQPPGFRARPAIGRQNIRQVRVRQRGMPSQHLFHCAPDAGEG